MISRRVWQLSTLSFYSIPFHSEVKDREHPCFISMCRCSICSFHNKASWSRRSYRHITLRSLTLLRIHISSLRPSLPSRLPAPPPCIKHTWRHKKTKKTNQRLCTITQWHYRARLILCWKQLPVLLQQFTWLRRALRRGKSALELEVIILMIHKKQWPLRRQCCVCVEGSAWF